ncbi:MAG: hypothetical protein HN374_05535 [Cryomorphaceae bacterium]|jgi:hypothetical protein|nr:hypothetical protein [Cryomorphaceae bacterium]
MSRKEELILVNQKLKRINIGDLPDNNLLADLFSQLDVLEGYINAKVDLLEQKNMIKWELNILKEQDSIINGIVQKINTKKLEKHETLYHRYKLCKKAIELMIILIKDLK